MFVVKLKISKILEPLACSHAPLRREIGHLVTPLFSKEDETCCIAIPCYQRVFSCCLLTGEKRPLPWVENGTGIEHAPRLSDRAIRDAPSTWRDSLKLRAVQQPQQMDSMADFSAFPFAECNKHSNPVDDGNKRFPMLVRQARKRVSPV